jgi:hypothetical protein
MSLPVLSYKEALLSNFTRTSGRIQTVSRRSKLNSGPSLFGEQPNPSYLFQHEDESSQHRGAKQPRRYGLLGVISLLSLAYL